MATEQEIREKINSFFQQSKADDWRVEESVFEGKIIIRNKENPDLIVTKSLNKHDLNYGTYDVDFKQYRIVIMPYEYGYTEAVNLFSFARSLKFEEEVSKQQQAEQELEASRQQAMDELDKLIS